MICSLIFWPSISRSSVYTLLNYIEDGLSEQHTSPISVFVLLLKELIIVAITIYNAFHQEFHTMKTLIFFEKFCTIRSLRHFPECETIVVISRWMTKTESYFAIQQSMQKKDLFFQNVSGFWNPISMISDKGAVSLWRITCHHGSIRLEDRVELKLKTSLPPREKVDNEKMIDSSMITSLNDTGTSRVKLGSELMSPLWR